MSNVRVADGHHRSINKLLAMAAAAGTRAADAERDSGFSDASSEHTSTMDAKDSDLTRRVPPQGAKRGSVSESPQLAVVGGSSYPNMSPMIIMNNVLLKQPSESPAPLKPWGFRPAVDVVQQPQVVFLQPVVSHQTPPSPKDPPSSRHRRPKKYLPILKSYPKIAPHPGDDRSSSSGRDTASSSSSSSVSLSSSSSRSKRGTKLTSSHRGHSHRGKRHHHHHHQKKKIQSGGRSSTSGTSTPSLKPLPSGEGGANEIPAASERLTPAVTAPPTLEFGPSPPPPQKTPLVPAPHRPRAEETGRDEGSDPETKRMRFCNTYNILSKSGLLDITLKTKELQRQNRRTQSELDRLKEHTELFMRALQSGDPAVFLTLEARLREDDTEREEDAGECAKDD